MIEEREKGDKKIKREEREEKKIRIKKNWCGGGGKLNHQTSGWKHTT